MTKAIRKDGNQNTLRLGVRFDGSSLVLLDGSALPRLRTGAFAELLLDAGVIADAAARARFTHDDLVQLLEKDTPVFLGVSPNVIEDPKQDGLIRNPQGMGLQTEYWLVEVRLDQGLCIRIRGDQEARLEKCRCFIPALNEKASSVNHAFTIVSEAYERKRLSHTGNVFERAYARLSPDGWKSLGDLRRAVVSTFAPNSSSWDCTQA